MHMKTNTEEYIPSAYGGDGYDAMEALKEDKGFTIYSAWGKDGWDAGEWPYVQVGLRTPDHVHHGEECNSEFYETLYYVEGDIDIKEFASREEAIQHLDMLVHFHWNTNHRGPKNPDLNNPDHCGPFKNSRLTI